MTTTHVSARRGLRRGLVLACAALVGLSGLLPAPAFAANVGCSAPAAPLAGARNLLLVGDSITTGTVGDYTWRYFLWQQLENRPAPVPVDFKGSDSTVVDYQNVGGTGITQDYAACDFDWNYEGTDGLKFADFDKTSSAYPTASNWIGGATTAYSADVVIALLGFNDLYQYADDHPGASTTTAAKVAAILADAKKFVQDIQAARPGADVILATSPGPADPYGPFAQALDDNAPGWSVGTSTVVVADLPSWAGHAWDGWHPDGQGDAGIGAAFAGALHEIDPAYFPAAQPAPTDVVIGPPTAAVLAAPTTPTDGTVALSWTMPTEGDRTLVKIRDVTAGTGWTTSNDLVWWQYKASFPDLGTGDACFPSRCTSTQVKGLISGDEYEFKLILAKGFSVSAVESNTVSATPTGTPVPVPTNVRAASGSRSATITWDAAPGATGYRIYDRKIGTSTWTKVGQTTTATSFAATNLTPSVGYNFAVSALGTGGTEGSLSVAVSVTPRYLVLTGPAKPRVTAVAGHRLRATWSARTGATRYLVEVRLGSKVVKSVFVTSPSYLSGRLIKGKAYNVRVRPYDGPQGGGYSAATSIKIK